MRKVNKSGVSMYIENEYTYIIERIKNDLNGNPIFNIIVFESGYYLESYNMRVYNSEMAIKEYKQRKAGK